MLLKSMGAAVWSKPADRALPIQLVGLVDVCDAVEGMGDFDFGFGSAGFSGDHLEVKKGCPGWESQRLQDQARRYECATGANIGHAIRSVNYISRKIEMKIVQAALRRTIPWARDQHPAKENQGTTKKGMVKNHDLPEEKDAIPSPLHFRPEP